MRVEIKTGLVGWPSGLHFELNRKQILWLERDFWGVRIRGWQLDLRTDAHRRLFSERTKGCGYRAQRHFHHLGLCFRATHMATYRASEEPVQTDVREDLLQDTYVRKAGQ